MVTIWVGGAKEKRETRNEDSELWSHHANGEQKTGREKKIERSKQRKKTLGLRQNAGEPRLSENYRRPHMKELPGFTQNMHFLKTLGLGEEEGRKSMARRSCPESCWKPSSSVGDLVDWEFAIDGKWIGMNTSRVLRVWNHHSDGIKRNKGPSHLV